MSNKWSEHGDQHDMEQEHEAEKQQIITSRKSGFWNYVLYLAILGGVLRFTLRPFLEQLSTSLMGGIFFGYIALVISVLTWRIIVVKRSGGKIW